MQSKRAPRALCQAQYCGAYLCDVLEFTVVQALIDAQGGHLSVAPTAETRAAHALPWAKNAYLQACVC